LLSAQGFMVLRVANAEVDGNPGAILAAILQAAERAEATPHPADARPP